MQIRHLKTLASANDSPARITAMAWSPNNQRLAVATADRLIHLFDETGERKDRFPTKAADPKSTSYSIVGLAWSPDSTRLAIAQSDAVVFVYKLGLEWGEKKSICNKLIQSVDVTSLTWPREQHNALVFGLTDGKVRIGNLKTNKSATLYQTESCVLSVASNVEGTAVISGHVDGSIHRFFFDDNASGAAQGKFTDSKSPPTCLVWGETIAVAGADRCVTFYDTTGQISQAFDFSRFEEQKEFTSAEVSPSGQTIVFGSFDRIHIFNYNITSNKWEEAQVKGIENFYTVTSLSWKPDGSRLVAANMCGAAELFDCCLKRTRYKGKFEFSYVSPSQVIVKRLSSGSRIVLKSHYQYEVQKINIFQDQFLIANTPETLLIGDLTSCKLSEIPWKGTSNEKYYFDNANLCMVFNAGELSLVEYGVNEIIGSCRTEYMSPHLISVRFQDRKRQDPIKKIAYLVDLQTVNILDVATSATLAAINHDSKIDWLELSQKADKLLFRDKRRQLHLFDVATQTRSTLLNFCSYVQWVPFSDVVVAQSRGDLCIWYSIECPERVTTFPIKGEIEDIERANGKTEVVVDEGVTTVTYTLDEGLIEFGSALDDRDYDRAIHLLENLEMTPETEGMWKTLSASALKDRKLIIAERCAAAMGDISRTRYLHGVNHILQAEHDYGIDAKHYLVRAKLALLDKQFQVAENIYLEQGKLEEAMDMYQDMHKWDRSIKIAELKNHPDLPTLKANYLQWLVDSGQEGKAGDLKAEEGDVLSAINLYIKGGFPSRAYSLLLKSGLESNTEVAERIAGALYVAGLYEKAGELYEKISSVERAMDAYSKGKAFRAAVDLARIAFPQEVVKIEEQWGDHLASIKQLDASINHYIESGNNIKAIEAAISSKQWKKATAIVDSLTSVQTAKRFFVPLATHFAEVADYTSAEKYFVMAEKHQAAVQMYTDAQLWEQAHSLALSFMSEQEVAVWYVSQAKDLEGKGRLRDAERLYLAINEPDLAITMFKNHKQYDQMIRLVAAHHKDLLVDTHLYLAKTLESEGNFKQAEHHFVEGDDFKSAINMYCANSLFEEAYKVAKNFGGPSATKQVAYLWARSLGGEAAVKLLSKFGLLEAAIEFAADNNSFEFAFELGRFASKEKLAEVHYKYAMYLEDEGRFKDAENSFILAGKPREAILMYIHCQDWNSALATAEAYEPHSVPDVLVGQAKIALTNKENARGEALILRAQRPDLAIKFYKELNEWNEAIRFAKEYMPNKLQEVNSDYEHFLSTKGSAGKEELLSSAKMFELQKDYSQAIDMYLRLSPASSSDIAFLEEQWSYAVKIAVQFVPDRVAEVSRVSGAKFLEVKRPETAGAMFFAVELYKEAIDAYVSGGLWEQAKDVLKRAPKYTEYLEALHAKNNQRPGSSNVMSSGPVTEGNLKLYAERGEWEKCIELAAAQKSESLGNYLTVYCTQLVKEGRVEQAVKHFAKYGTPLISTNFDLYDRLASEVLRRGRPDAIASLRDMVFKLIYGTGLTVNANVSPQFHKYLMISHLKGLQTKCKNSQELAAVAAKQAISLLRYTKVLRPDAAFFEAGQAAKNAGMNNMAFVCWNRFLDMSDAIEEGSNRLLENADFADTDVPFDVELPRENLPEKLREEVRDWVLQVSLDQKVTQELDSRTCAACNANVYDASLSCKNCKHVEQPCIVTGYPVLRNKVSCTKCNKPANRDDWNKYVMIAKECPWCKSAQTPVYFN